MKEEEIIRKRCGESNPFRVPEGYFDDFASNLMDKLPERENRTIPLSSRHSRMHVLRPVLLAAACLCFAILSTLIFFHKNVESNSPENARNTAVKVSNDELIDRTADYAMMDNHDIYACMSSEE